MTDPSTTEARAATRASKGTPLVDAASTNFTRSRDGASGPRRLQHGTIERSRETLGEAEYLAALEIVDGWLSRELARARKASRRLKVVA